MDENQLAGAADAAAQRLAAGGAGACANGTVLHCRWAAGPRVAARNSLRPVPGFSAAHLVDQVAAAVVQALLDARRQPPAPRD